MAGKWEGDEQKRAERHVTARILQTFVTAMTRKDEKMEWKLIETKWAAMARRIRADAPFVASDDGPVAIRSSRRADSGPGAVVTGIAAPGTETVQKRNPVSTP